MVAPFAWEKTAEIDSWHGVRPKKLILLNSPKKEIVALSTQKKTGQRVFDFAVDVPLKSAFHWARFCEQIPGKIREPVHHFQTRQWHALALLSRVPEVESLVHQSPLLAFCLASSWIFRKNTQPMRLARRLVRRKQKEIAAYLGFPETTAVRRVLKKIPPVSCSIEGALWLRTTLTGPQAEAKQALKLLAHVPTVTTGVRRLVCDDELRQYVTPKFLDEISQDPSAEKYAWAAYQLRDVLHLLHHARPHLKLPRLQTLKHFERLSNEVLEDIYNSGGLENLDLVFPEPPIDEDLDSGIRALCNQRQLLEHAKRMHNCSARLGLSVMRGKLFVYEVSILGWLSTLSVIRRYDEARRPPASGWKIGNLLGIANEEPSEETVRIVKNWFARYTRRLRKERS